MNAQNLMEAFGALPEEDLAHELADSPAESGTDVPVSAAIPPSAHSAVSKPHPNHISEETPGLAAHRFPLHLAGIIAAAAACIALAAGFVCFLSLFREKPQIQSSMPELQPIEPTTTVQTVTAVISTETTAVSKSTAAPETVCTTTGTDTAAAASNHTESEISTITAGTQTETTAPPEQNSGYRAIFGREGQLKCYEGEALDFSKLTLTLCLRMPNGEYRMTNCRFTVGSGEHAHCYTIDTSEVDTGKAGTYYAYIETAANAEDDFYLFRDDANNAMPEGTVHAVMDAHRTAVYVEVWKKHTDLQFSCKSTEPDGTWILPDNGAVQFYTLNNLWDSAVTYTFSDPAIAEIDEQSMDTDGCNQVLRIRGLQCGETILTAETDDGRTASITVRVIPAEEYFREPETTGTTAVW